MARKKHYEKGFSIVSVVVGILIGSGLFVLLGIVYGQSEAVLDANRKKIMAEQYASELMEYFRSFDTDQLHTYLKKNPSLATGTPYPMCSHINLLNRSTSAMLNPDPLAKLPTTALVESNRFYMVYVVDATTMVVNQAYCNQPATAFTLGADERFFVTVGVSWKSDLGAANERTTRVVLSGLIP